MMAIGKKLMLGAAVAALFANVGSAVVQSQITDVLNEYGPGSYAIVNGAMNQFTPYGTAGSEYNYATVSEFGAGNPATLTYFYPTSLAITGGAIALTDAQGLSDVIVFNSYVNSQNQNFDYASFYSLDHVGAPADQPYTGSTQGLPTFSETAPYTPVAGQAGYVSGYTITYEFISSIPEPGAYGVVAGVGGAGLLIFSLGRKRVSRGA
jgi:hypothetical protein